MAMDVPPPTAVDHTDRPFLVIAAVVIAAVVIALLAGCSSSSDLEPVEGQPVELGGSAIAVTPVDEELWIVVDRADGQARQVVVLDAATAETMTETMTGGKSLEVGGAVLSDGEQLWVEADPQPGIPSIGDTSDGAVAAIALDRATIEPIRQVGLGVEPPWFLFFTVLDGTVWVADGSLSRIDPDTGQEQLLGLRGVLGHEQLVVEDGHIWWSDEAGVSRFTPAGFEVIGIEYDQIDGSFVGVKFHDGRTWLSGAVRGEPDLAYPIELETGDLSEPIDASELPTRSFEADGERWELHNPAWHHDRPVAATEDDEWRRVDLATGEVIGRYDLGSSTAITVSGGHVWLLDVEAGVVSRVPIADL
ncbi:MAG: hypothetical protein AAFO29_06325 [Actinomycetota bacterium]